MAQLLLVAKAIWLPTAFTLSCLACMLLTPLAIIPALFGLGDAIARYKDFKRLEGTWVRKAQMKIMRHSMCQRNACIASCKEAKLFYKNLGYRWYHVLPDGTFTIKDNPYLKMKFYKNLLGIR